MSDLRAGYGDEPSPLDEEEDGMFPPLTAAERIQKFRDAATIMQEVIDGAADYDPHGHAIAAAKIQSQLVEFIQANER